MMISNLPRDLVEEILARVPVKSIGAVRSTCKKWNVLSKDERFANKHIDKAAAAAREKEYLIITAGGSMDYLISVSIYETCNKNFGLSINPKAISIERLGHSGRTVFISQAFLSQGLLLCVWSNSKSRLLVWNLYWGKRRWIECPTHCLNEKFAFGYDRSCGSRKILRFSNDSPHMEIYYLSSDSWRNYDASFNRNTIKYTEPGLSLKGNTYWYARDYESKDGFLHCFDFTRERFGPRLPLPPCSQSFHTVSLSSVKEEKLAVLFSPWDTDSALDIWVTNKIEPYEVSWSIFFKVETMQQIYHGFNSSHFFIDEEKKVIVVFDRYDEAYYICGESGPFRKMYPREYLYTLAYKHVGCYVPSSVQI
ncbi:hypothetical protein Bca4012_068406 [Brassica carinata]|uniref:F-box domain-containing protein n=1 Tax=Brassica carinata TaxID=52824 RepID=A0A8X8AYN5_BRACI|nr:hypothetical protein Bca52824_020636 [Brassica carinata]